MSAAIPVPDEEDAVRLQVEVSGTVFRRELLLLFGVLDVEPDRRTVLVVHASVHREEKRFAVRVERRNERPEIAERRAALVIQEKPDVVLPRIEVADDIGRLARRLIAAGGLRAAGERNGQRERGGDQARHGGLSFVGRRGDGDRRGSRPYAGPRRRHPAGASGSGSKGARVGKRDLSGSTRAPRT